MEYIILELIPTSQDIKTGEIIQLSALKIKDLQLIDRFDYRLIEDKIYLKELVEMFSYNKESFIYKNTTKEIIDEFKNFSKDLPLLIINNKYTLSYLSELDNKKESIFNHFNMEYNDDIIEEVIKKYNLQPSDYIVHLLFEALIYESNKKNIDNN